MNLNKRQKTYKGLLVEMFGISGAGKTTLGSRVKNILNQRGITANYQPCGLPKENGCFSERLMRWIPVIPFVLANPGYIFRSARIILSRKDRNKTYTHRYLNGWLFASYLNQRYRRLRGVTLFVQSLFQVLWSIGFGSRDGYLLNLPSSFLKSIRVADMVVIVEADLATIERRLDARPGKESCLEKWGLHDGFFLNKSLNVFNDVKKILADINRQYSGMQILVVDNSNDKDLETNAIKIADVIEQLWNRKMINEAQV